MVWYACNIKQFSNDQKIQIFIDKIQTVNLRVKQIQTVLDKIQHYGNTAIASIVGSTEPVDDCSLYLSGKHFCLLVPSLNLGHMKSRFLYWKKIISV